MANVIRCVSAQIYRWNLGDCSNNGVSSRFDDVFIPCPDGHIDVDADNPPENLCRIVRRNIGGREYVHVEPVGVKDKMHMSGGTYVHSNDDRFDKAINNGGYPVSLHDRVEG